jgi:hypothetical protein
MMKPIRLVGMLAYVSLGKLKGEDERYADKAYHEDAAGLQSIGEVASCDAEHACYNVWRDLGDCQLGQI